MHVEDIELFFILKALGTFVGACLSLGGWVGKDGLLCRKWYLFFRLFSLWEEPRGISMHTAHGGFKLLKLDYSGLMNF